MSYNLNSLMGGYIGDYIGIIWGTTIGSIKGDIRSLGYCSMVLEGTFMPEKPGD